MSLQVIAKTLNNLVDDATVPDLNKLVQEETYFERMSKTHTYNHLMSFHNAFVVDNFVDTEHDIIIQDLSMVVEFNGKIDYRLARYDCKWIVRTFLGINFIQAPCLIIKKDILRSLLLPHVPLSDDAEPNLSGQPIRLNGTVDQFISRVTKNDCHEDVKLFVDGTVSLVVNYFRTVDQYYVATPLSYRTSALPTINDFTFDLTS